jgi:Amt family ammonium transporter
MASTWGTLATGLFATVAVNADASNGLFFGNPSQFAVQLIAVIVTIVFAFGMTYVLAKALDMSIGLRVSPIEEEVGLDISSHGERSYS